jgi:hypothetical protein
MRDRFILGEVARVLKRNPHQVVYPLVTGKIPEPQMRLAGKRLFTVEDVNRLAKHFRVAPDWSALQSASAEASPQPPERLTLRSPFEVVQISETGHEVRDSSGEIFAWAGDRGHALILAGLLEAAARG